jgi:hypothetical protein
VRLLCSSAILAIGHWEQEAGMISNSGDYATAVDDGDGIPAPLPRDQDVILEAWREVLGEVLHTRDS